MEREQPPDDAAGPDADAGTGPPIEHGAPATEGADRAAPPTGGSRAAALFEVLVCSGFPTQLFVAQLLAIAGLRPFTAAGHYSTAFIFTLSLVDALLLVTLITWFLWRRGESPWRVLFGTRPLLPEGVLGILLIPFVFLLAVLVLGLARHFTPWLHNVPNNPLEALMKTRLDAVLFAFVAIVSGGIREEVQRAFILHRFEQRLGGGLLGLVVSSLVFGAGHVIQGWDAAIATATFGAFWAAIYLIRRSIGAPLISHAGFDLAMIIRYTLYGL